MTFKSFVTTYIRGDRGQKIVWSPLWERVAGALEDPEAEEIVVRVPRQSGKSTIASAWALYLAWTQPRARVLYISSSLNAARACWAQKFQTVVTQSGPLSTDAEVGEFRIQVPRQASVIELTPADPRSIKGRTLDYLVIDEADEISDPRAYADLVPSLAAREGSKRLIASSVYHTSRWFRACCEQSAPGRVVIEMSGDDLNPARDAARVRREKSRLATLGVIGDALYRRQFENEWAELGDLLISREDVGAAIVARDRIPRYWSASGHVFAFADLSTRRDLTSICVVRRVEDRVVLEELRAYDPAAFPGGRIDLQLIEHELELVWRKYRPTWFGCDFHQAALMCQQLQSRGVRIEEISITAVWNQEAYGRMSEAFLSRRIWIPKETAHRDRLVAELGNIKVEETLTAWRAVDNEKRLHRDLAMSLAGALWKAMERKPFNYEPNYRKRSYPEFPVPGPWVKRPDGTVMTPRICTEEIEAERDRLREKYARATRV